MVGGRTDREVGFERYSSVVGIFLVLMSFGQPVAVKMENYDRYSCGKSHYSLALYPRQRTVS